MNDHLAQFFDSKTMYSNAIHSGVVGERMEHIIYKNERETRYGSKFSAL